MTTKLEKVSFHSNPKERQCQRMFKLPQIALISHTSKVMLKILQVRLQHYVIREFPDVQAGFRKGRETRDQIANIHGIIEKPREFQKNICFLLTISKPWLCGSQQTVENSSRDGKTRIPDLPPEKSVCRSGNKLELDMERQTGSKLGNEFVQAVYCHPAYLSYMQSTSWKTLGWMKHKWHQDCWEKYQ